MASIIHNVRTSPVWYYKEESDVKERAHWESSVSPGLRLPLVILIRVHHVCSRLPSPPCSSCSFLPYPKSPERLLAKDAPCRYLHQGNVVLHTEINSISAAARTTYPMMHRHTYRCNVTGCFWLVCLSSAGEFSTVCKLTCPLSIRAGSARHIYFPLSTAALLGEELTKAFFSLHGMGTLE